MSLLNTAACARRLLCPASTLIISFLCPAPKKISNLSMASPTMTSMSYLLSPLGPLASIVTRRLHLIRWRHASALLNALSARVVLKTCLAMCAPTVEVDSLRDLFVHPGIGRMETILVHFRRARMQSISLWIRQFIVVFRPMLRGLPLACVDENA